MTSENVYHDCSQCGFTIDTRALTAERDALRARLDAAETALRLIATTEPWQRCPSTHCERRKNCASPYDCSGTGKGVAQRALATIATSASISTDKAT